MLNISYELSSVRKEKPSPNGLKFGKTFTDHMFIMNYDAGKGWHDARIVPYGDISLSPAAMVLHYAQELFEGLKAYRDADGVIRLFRPDCNINRMNDSCERLCVPKIDPEDAMQAITALVETEKDWVPDAEGTSLYIRPFIIATDPWIGVHPSHSYMFIIITSPSGSYYENGIDPVGIIIEREYVRAVRGGTGMAKAGGNYAASLIGQMKAEELGYAQVLWLDGVEHKYIDEVGAMNVFFVINGVVVTPELGGSILPGVTRRSCIELLKAKGYKVEERRISVDEIVDAYKNGTLDEAFGSGTAAVISPIGELCDMGENGAEPFKMKINGGKIGPVSQMMYDTLTGIQWGRIEGPEGWSVKVCKA